MDEDLKDTLGREPVITYRRAKTLGDRLVYSHFSAPKVTTLLPQRPAGCFKCGGCIACESIYTGKEFFNANTQETFKLKKFGNCRSTGVIYRATCQCGITYVGKTIREFRRVGEHLGDIRHQRDTPIAKHVNGLHGGDTKVMRFMGIDKIDMPIRGGDLDRLLLQREASWIFTLDTCHPRGLNDQINFVCFFVNQNAGATAGSKEEDVIVRRSEAPDRPWITSSQFFSVPRIGQYLYDRRQLNGKKYLSGEKADFSSEIPGQIGTSKSGSLDYVDTVVGFNPALELSLKAILHLSNMGDAKGACNWFSFEHKNLQQLSKLLLQKSISVWEN
ncbi:unnamed protein product [Ranitomeya imitator]|uniref:GIY-YIG domain-containing protein n=1 Tax=Ranitomeya imitator TaxID=111125 RepID=A0ABN9LSB7_9NEOB|nr:unnamed protein product [Ranitomeya imitator]